MAIKIHEIEKVYQRITVSKRPRRNKAKIVAWNRKEKKETQMNQ